LTDGGLIDTVSEIATPTSFDRLQIWEANRYFPYDRASEKVEHKLHSLGVFLPTPYEARW